jgi:hypothetical protein
MKRKSKTKSFFNNKRMKRKSKIKIFFNSKRRRRFKTKRYFNSKRTTRELLLILKKRPRMIDLRKRKLKRMLRPRR